jgi:multiple sugar transport system ATP-binding protein
MNFLHGTLVDGVVETHGLSLPTDDYDFTASPGNHLAVTIGIRPEDILIGDQLARSKIQTSVIVDLVEPMGADTLVYADLDGQLLRIRTDGKTVINAGQKLTVGLEPARASLFDTTTEARL